ncbi:MAG: galactokinase [Clostridia bacterium]|nr:galactokinase [Clostridia bacterium]
MNYNALLDHITSGALDGALEQLYGKSRIPSERERYANAVRSFGSLYGTDRELAIFSTPGRSELSGNHTDHNNGRVIACAVDLDVIAVASPRGDGIIRVKSEGFDEEIADASNEPDEREYFTGTAILRGMRAEFEQNCSDSCGFDAYTTSDVPKGSGLSSSAAFEVLVGSIINEFSGAGADPAKIARIAQYAENVYFGKPCGLMDQTACAVGGVVSIDFEIPGNAVIEKMDFDFRGAGYALCIINTGGNHANLTPDYAAIPAEMKQVAAHFGADCLREISMAQLLPEIMVLREKVGDRAILRAFHFLRENERVAAQTAALQSGNLTAFLEGMLASGRSSFEYLQNVWTTALPDEQGVSLALAAAEEVLAKYNTDGVKAAWRVHGGGFAGTVQTLIPLEAAEELIALEDSIFGEGAAKVLTPRAAGAVRVV